MRGRNGFALLALFPTPKLNWLRHLPAVALLREVWVPQFEVAGGKVHFRPDDTIPPPATMICSPYDDEATYGRKLTTWWVGYKVHLTESCS